MKYLRGKVDEVRISNIARYTPATAPFTPSKNHTSDANTNALWKCNEGSATTVADGSGITNTVSLRNGTLWWPGVTTNYTDGGRPKYPMPPDLIVKAQTFQRYCVRTETVAQQAEQRINRELQQSIPQQHQ